MTLMIIFITLVVIGLTLNLIYRTYQSVSEEADRYVRPPTFHPNSAQAAVQLVDDISDWVVKQRDRMQRQRAKEEKEERRLSR
jgi:hypothetical protein